MLTKRELLEIVNLVKADSIKDSELPSSTVVKGGDYITIVQDGESRKIRSEVFINAVREHMEGGGGGAIPLVETLADLEEIGLRFYGNLVYVKETDSYYTFSKAGFWEQMLKIHIGNEEPQDPNCLWIDWTDEDTLDADQDEDIKNLTRAVQVLQEQVLQLNKIISLGAIPGDSSVSFRKDLIYEAEPEKPIVVNEQGEDVIPESEAEKPDASQAECTVKAVCAKQDTAVNFALNRLELIDGEILFYTDKHKFAVYSGGKFYTIQSQDQSGEEGGLSVDDLYKLQLDHLLFTDGYNTYKVQTTTDGNWKVALYRNTNTPVGSVESGGLGGSYITHLLTMNSIFCGGDYNENNLVSHNYIELQNSSNNDINLKGMYILYTDCSKEVPTDTGYYWRVLPLEGVIKAGGTFVIRGKRCNSDKASLIKVDSYDMEWFDDRTNGLIFFNQGCSSFYLCVGNAFQDELTTRTLSIPWSANSVKVGYIDSCGFGQSSVGEGSSTFLVYDKNKQLTTDWSNILFVRWFSLDPSKQANKAYASRKTTDLWTYINLDKQTTKQGNSIQYYYPDNLKVLNAPKASYLGKNFFTNKSSFRDDVPNMINVTFGIQATQTATKGATRCFNWVSVGNYDEYVEYRQIGSNAGWIRCYSIIEGDVNNTEAINKFIDHYKRYRWAASDGTWVTTHKCIIHNLNAGQWEYRIGRDNDSNYISDILTFTVESDANVGSFSFIQVSDQQGFNWMEYTAWKKAAYMINQKETGYKFTINTGDITQSGNRVSEWLDYYNGREYLRNKEEMFTIGNNDLCGHVSTELTDGEDATSKYNHINVLRYFCFELDPNNDYSVEWDNETYPIYSLYSFNYGAYHFVCLNSEVAIASSKMYKDWESNTYAGDRTFADAVNAKIEDWFKKDLQIWKNTTDNPVNCSKCICYMHEMPFTIVTYSFMAGSSARAGSHLNTLNSNGNYRFSRLFKKYGIRLVIGGHKHTYCLTKPVYDAPEGYISGGSVVPSIDLMEEVTDANSRKPVIQVLRQEDIKESDFARYEYVTAITAPVYVMCQASGYKLVSNKEQPSDNTYVIPWLMAYFKQPPGTATGTTENVAQHKPMYIRYDLNNTEIKVTANQVENIWDVNIQSNKKSFDINRQLVDLDTTKMTLSTTSDEDKEAYNITNIESYTITL